MLATGRQHRKVGFGLQRGFRDAFLRLHLSSCNPFPFSFFLSAVVGFVVSTIPELAMLTEMASRRKCQPFSDILLGIPICKSKLSAISELKNELASATNNEGVIHLLIDHAHQVEFLEDFIMNSPSPSVTWSVFLKIDSGYHRAGVTCDSRGISVAWKIIDSSCLSLKGLYSHW
jgi:D-serine deaminase-like pyridoxal phosphate-dependent protein